VELESVDGLLNGLLGTEPGANEGKQRDRQLQKETKQLQKETKQLLRATK